MTFSNASLCSASHLAAILFWEIIRSVGGWVLRKEEMILMVESLTYMHRMEDSLRKATVQGLTKDLFVLALSECSRK